MRGGLALCCAASQSHAAGLCSPHTPPLKGGSRLQGASPLRRLWGQDMVGGRVIPPVHGGSEHHLP